jgi:predicted amidohydrolase YtcJ
MRSTIRFIAAAHAAAWAAAGAAAGALLAACSASVTASVEVSPAGGAPADSVLFHGGRIHLGAPDWRRVDALLAVGGRVRAVGSEAELRRALPPGCREVDLAGATAVPGLQDAHGHVESYGKSLETVDLKGCASYAELCERVAAQAALQPPGTWVEGRGWDQTRWSENAFPHHRALSERVPDHPVYLARVDGHAALANARALEAAGLTGPQASEHPVPGGELRLDPERRPTGVLVDAAMGLVSRHLPEPDEATRVRRILRAQTELLAQGLTCVHDMGVSRSTIDLLARLRDDGRLKLRLVEYLHGNRELGERDLRGLPLAPDPRDRLCAIGVKLLVDGALGSRGAALLEPYDDAPGETGLVQLTPDELRERIATCAAAGLQPAIHAIGDRGNRMVLDAYEAELKRNPGFAELRPRVEHAQVVSPEDWGRFAALGAIPSMQPTHATSDMRWAQERLGARRLPGAYAWRRLAPDLSSLAFGSDFPVEETNPLLGLYAALTRQDAAGWPEGGWLGDQRLDARTALAAFTSGAAYAAHQEDRRGRLAPGYRADLSAFDVDPLECEPRELLAARCVMTVIDGEVVWRF